MSISFTVFAEDGFFVSSWVGRVTDSDLLSSYKQLLESEEFRPGFHEIADVRNAQMPSVTSGGLRQLVSMVETYLAGKCDGFKTAVIAPETLPFGLARQYAVFSDKSPENVMVFKEPKEALKWIGAPDSILD